VLKSVERKKHGLPKHNIVSWRYIFKQYCIAAGVRLPCNLFFRGNYIFTPDLSIIPHLHSYTIRVFPAP